MSMKKIHFRVMISTVVADDEPEYETHEVIRQIERSGWSVEEITRLVGDPTSTEWHAQYIEPCPGCGQIEDHDAGCPVGLGARGEVASGYLGMCNMSGHSERGCDGGVLSSVRHRALIKQGVGFSTVPGPSDAEIAAESADLSRSRMERIVDDPMSDF